MKYHLSNRQRKELANGKTLCVALPIESLPADPEAAIRRLVDLPADAVIIRPIESVVRINPIVKSTGMSSVLGAIIQDDRLPLPIELSVNVVSFHLSSRREQRGNYPTQWPGSVTLDDGRILP